MKDDMSTACCQYRWDVCTLIKFNKKQITYVNLSSPLLRPFRWCWYDAVARKLVGCRWGEMSGTVVRISCLQHQTSAIYLENGHPTKSAVEKTHICRDT